MPRHAREVYVRRRIAAAVIGVLGLSSVGLGGYSAVALGLPLPEAAVVARQPELPVGAPALPEPAPFGSSGIGAVGWAEPLVVAGDPAPRPIASITKVVTALVVLDRMPIAEGDGPTRVLTDQDEAYYGESIANAESRAPAYAGTEITERDALEAMLVSSAGNYARTLVDWAFGSQEAYVAAAAEWLAANGLTGTTIVDPTGVDPGNTSTIPDLVRIGALALEQPVLAGIVAQPAAELPDVGTISTTNALLGVDGIDGIKTGTLDEAGACLLFSADIVVAGESITLVGAVLGGPDHGTVNASVRALLASASAGFQELTLPAGTSFGGYETAWGDRAAAVTTEPVSFLVWGPESLTASATLEPVTTAPRGTAVGAATVSSPRGERTVPLALDASLVDPGAGWRWTHPGR